MALTFPTAVPPPTDLTPVRVLVVDDDPLVRTFVSTVLRRAGHETVPVSDVNTAIELLADTEFEVALVDLDMPVRNGLEFLEELRAGGHMVVPVLLTGTSDVAAAVEGMKRGAFDYLAKPAKPDAIRWTVGRAATAYRARKRVQVLEQVVSEWATTFDACSDVILVVDPKDHILKANRAGSEQCGRPADALLGRLTTEVFFTGLCDAIADGREAADGRARRVYDPDRSEYLMVSVNRIPPASASPGVVVIIRDVTEGVRAEETRSRLLRQLHTAQEDERVRLSRELHDGIGQSLVSLMVGLDTLADGSPALEWAERVQRLSRLAGEASEETRRMARGLRPLVLKDLGLKAALARLTDDFTQLHGVRADLVTPDSVSERFTDEVESAAYRIAQEALANVAKHAVAKTVDVVLDVSAARLHLSVSDDGIGFTPTRWPRTAASGFGLSDMRERATLLGGTMQIVSTPGRGTTVDVWLPTGGER